jgi:hypothetical protein
MPRYALFIYGTDPGDTTADDDAAVMSAYFAYNQELAAAGVMRGGEALMPSGDAARVQVRDGRMMAVDGPFTETKESLGGYYVIECEGMEQAKHWASRCPGALGGVMEVRLIAELPPEMMPGA